MSRTILNFEYDCAQDIDKNANKNGATNTAFPYSVSQRVINEWNKLSNDCVNASNDKGGLYIDDNIV